MSTKRGLNAFHLKIIGILAMTICHIPYGIPALKQNTTIYLLMSFIGGITLPTMAFLLVEGFRHTRHRGRYVARLAAFWVLSIVPYWLLFIGGPFRPIYLLDNIMYTLMMGLLLLICYEKTENIALRLLLVASFTLATRYSDWYITGVLIIFGMYVIKERVWRVVLPILLIAALPAIYSTVTMYMSGTFVLHTMVGNATTAGTMLSIPFLLCYNGKRGMHNEVIKWGFYAYYPLHLIALLLIRALL